MKMNRFVPAALAALALNIAACGEPLEVELNDEAGASGAAGARQPQPNQPSCDPAKADCDGDGRLGDADCAPNDAAAFVGASELCDNKDNDCDGIVDEGCPGDQPPQPPATADSDGDGYPDGPQDCAPRNPAVHPGATEVCADGVDNDCDGVTDENCPAGTTQPPPPPPNGQALACTFTWGTDRQRTVNAQAYDDKADLGGWWDRSESSSGRSITIQLGDVPQDICGFRLNTAEGNPPADWFCEGNGSTANLDPSTGVSCSFGNRSATKSGLRTWSAPGGTAAGCSAVWVVSNAAGCW